MKKSLSSWSHSSLSSAPQRHKTLGQALYGALFVVVLPALLVYWAVALDRIITWPVPMWRTAGVLLVAASAFLMGKGMLDLHVYGEGLPMNAYPPRRYVARGLYALFNHPIYLGAVLAAGGISLLANSSSGLYVVTPMFALMILAYVFGYERFRTMTLFGEAAAAHVARISLAGLRQGAHRWPAKLFALVAILLPWYVIGYLIDTSRCALGCEWGFAAALRGIPRGDITAWLWLVPYAYLILAVVMARAATLPSRAIAAALGAAGGLYAYLLLPMLAPTLVASTAFQFFVSAIVVLVAAHYRTIWDVLRQAAQWVANSRRDWLFFGGRFRVVNHSLFACAAGAVGTYLAIYVIGSPSAVLLMLLCGLVGAALFAQAIWGNKTLLRPFGYWGGIAGGTLGVVLVNRLFGITLPVLALGGALCLPFAQALGRLRCLSQGCCHGVQTSEPFGIRVWQTQSRVCTLSGLRGEWILATQLYSIGFNVLLLGPLLWALWWTERFPATFIIGLYLALTGLERFAEDGYRGETQTKVVHGLKESQWWALISLLAGIAVTTIPSAVHPVTAPIPEGSAMVCALLGGLLTAFLLSMDFPQSTRRFSRLSG